MLKRKFSKLNEIGSLMVEAMAMLALISMVTPIIYRKAAERTSELQDINAASQVRSLIKSVDDYVKDNYDSLISGQTIAQAECSTSSMNYSAFSANTANVMVPMDHFCNYLPYGFLGSDKKAQDSKTFSKDYKIVLKKVSGDAERKKTITAFLVANPAGADLPALRSSRIASMIGSNGGYIEGTKGNGVQGIWTVNNLGTDLGLAAADYKNGAIMASSMQSISASGGGDSSENVLYRNKRAGKDYLNTMETHLSMGESAGRQYNIKNINQLIVGANSADQMDGGIEKALYLKKGGIDVGGKASISSAGAIIGASLSTGSGSISGGPISGTTGTFTGDVKGANGIFSGDVSGVKGIFSGAVTGASYTGGPITGTTGTFSGAVTAASLDTGSGAIKGGPITGTIGTFTEKVVTPLLDATDIIGNVVTARNTLNVGVEGVDATVNNTGAYFKKDIFEVGAAGTKVKITGTTTEIRNLTSVDIGISDARGLLVDATGVDLSSDKATVVFGKDSVNIGTDPTKIVNIQADLLKATMPVSDAKGLVEVRDDFKSIDSRFKTTRTGTTNTMVFSPISDTAGEAVIYANHTDGNAAPRLDIRSNVLQVDSNAISDYNSVASGTVPTNQVAGKGSVYVRDGTVELRSKYGSIDTTTYGVNPNDGNKLFSGHIKADRFVDNKALSTELNKYTGAGYTTGLGVPADATYKAYDAYQVNPAYTSVMHDIKLTTRGGARLSDILPDFINKGIYVVDNTYTEDVGSWESLTTMDQLKTHGNGKDCGGHTCRTSPWLGWVPPPQCPPGYGKVITITPAGWAMAQAGTPGVSGKGSKKSSDIAIAYDPRKVTDPLYDTDPNTVATPLYFQKSTWLRANVYPHGSNTGFAGWSAIMGFMYPHSYYKDYIEYLWYGSPDKPVANDKTIVWNLFPVFKQQLEAYATVYCYFDRSSFNSTYVSSYDQLANQRAVYDKADSSYVNRLNDETLPYYDPW